MYTYGDGSYDYVLYESEENVDENLELFGGSGDNAQFHEDIIGPFNFRLCFKLKDELPIISGTGEQDTPYQLVEAE